MEDSKTQETAPLRTWERSERIVRSVVPAHPGTRVVFYNRETKEIWEERVLLWCVYRHRLIACAQRPGRRPHERPHETVGDWEIRAGGLVNGEFGVLSHPEEFESVFVGYLSPDEERSGDWWGRNGIDSPEHGTDDGPRQ